MPKANQFSLITVKVPRVLTTTIKNLPAQSLSQVHFRPSIRAVLMIKKSPMRQVV